MRNLFFLTLLFSTSLQAKTEAFGGPGIKANWSPASKTHIGTAYNSGMKSPLWFTSAEGMLTEVYFPTVDKAQLKDSQLLVSDGKTFMLQERDLNHRTEVLSASDALIINGDAKNRFTITHRYFTDPSSPVLYDEMTIKTNVDGLKFYLLSNPHLNNTGYDDMALVDEDGFTIRENQTMMKIRATSGFRKKSVGYVGFSDGYQDLFHDFKMDFQFLSASYGNTATMGELNLPSAAGEYKVTVVYSFKDLLQKNLTTAKIAQVKSRYDQGWNSYTGRLKIPSNLSAQESLLYLRSLYTLKCHEDKSHPGAIIASISVPWGESQYDQPGVEVGGYHLVWPRDLYNIALAMFVAGDKETAIDSLRFLKKIQFTAADGNYQLHPRVIQKKGSFPQNVWVSGKTYWEGFQIDQTGYPVLLFAQIFEQSTDAEKKALLDEFGHMIKSALDFIAFNGPWTQQERWEENFGISPSSFSSAAAALLSGGKIYKDEYGLKLVQLAKTWLHKPYDNIDSWTFTTNGVYGDGEYYLRVAGGDTYDASWNPNAAVNTHIANSSIKMDQRKILDQGFLQLSLLGLKPASDEKLKKSKRLIDQHISHVTPNGRGYYRYSFDAYGENSKGRLWPLLSGEHARFDLERFNQQDLTWNEALRSIDEVLGSMLKFANEGLMIPEQVWEHSGEGTGSATPLAWSHAEYVKLLWSKDLKFNVENLFRDELFKR